jgi:hypothetical protein
MDEKTATCSTTWKEAKDRSELFKKILLVILPAGALAYIIFMAYVFWDAVTIDPDKWSILFNARGPLVLIQVPLVNVMVFFFDWITPGHTIRSILCLKENATAWDKTLAVVFLLGMGYLNYLALTRVSVVD